MFWTKISGLKRKLVDFSYYFIVIILVDLSKMFSILSSKTLDFLTEFVFLEYKPEKNPPAAI